MTKCPRRWRWTWDVGLRNVAWDTVIPRESEDPWENVRLGAPRWQEGGRPTPIESYQLVEQAHDWQREEHKQRTIAVERAMRSVVEPWERDNLARVLKILRAGRLVAIPGREWTWSGYRGIYAY